MIFGGIIARRYNPRLILSTFGLLGPICLWLCSIIQNYRGYLILVTLSYSVFRTICYIIPVHHIWLWFPDRKGTATGLVISMMGLSGFITNHLVIKLVNPEELQATSEGIYPDKVNKRVQFMFKSLGYIYGSFVLLSIIFMFPGPQ